MDKIASLVNWEKNGLVVQNKDISPNQIFARCTTDKFPEGCSVRINNQSKGTATVYFRDPFKEVTRGGQTWTQCDSVLKVTLPLRSNWNGQEYNYSMTGRLPKKYDLGTFAMLLQYVREELENMSGSAFQSIPKALI